VGKLPTPKRGKYKFLGWYTKVTGGSKISSSTRVKSSVTYYAHWASPWTVKLNVVGGTLPDDVSNKVLVMRGKAVGKLPTPSKKGYTFKGWWTKKSGGAKVTSKTKPTKSMTIYAQWAAKKKKK